VRALIYDGPSQLHIGEIDRPTPGRGEVAVRVRGVGIWGSNAKGYRGKSKRRGPGRVGGHEGAGEMAEAGPGVPEGLMGRRVGVNPNIGCRHCPACERGESNLCPQRRTLGVNMGMCGAFSEAVTVPSENCVPVSDHVPYSHAALAEPLAVGLRAAHLASAGSGIHLLVVGGGTIGLCAMLAARLCGATVYLAEPVEERLRLAKSLGAVPLGPPGTAIAEAARALRPEGMEAAIDAVGTGETLAGALGAVRHAGSVIWVGNVAPTVEIPCNPVLTAERILRGCYAYSVAEYREAVSLINSGSIRVGELIGETCDLDKAPEMFSALATGRNRSIKVVVEP